MELFPQVPRAPVRVVDDLGPVGKGAAHARVVIAENGEEYLIKGPSLVRDHPTVAANEWIAAELAAMLQMPVQDHVIAEMNGATCSSARSGQAPLEPS